MLLISGCGGTDERAFLSVSVQSDLAGGQDFAVVLSELVSDDGTALSATHTATSDMDFSKGVSVARWDGLSHGNYALRVKLVRSDGRLVAQSDRVVTLTRSFESMITVNQKTCEEIDCAEGNTCVNGVCVVTTCVINPSAPECHPEMPDPDPDAGMMMCTDCDATVFVCTTGQMQNCSNTNAAGTCTGTQTCDANAWGLCNAKTPAVEVADGQDNDCDGSIDEGTACVPNRSCQPLEQCTSINDGCNTVSCPCPGGPYEGRLIAAQDRPLAFVTTGKRINFQTIGPATYLSHQDHLVLDQGTYDAIAAMANMNIGATVYAAGGPAAFLLTDNRLYAVDCLGIISANSSSITNVSQATFDSYALGPPLHCVP